MTEPRRLIEECDNELERQILLAGSLSSANNLRRVKVLAALGVGVAVVSTSKTSFAWLLTWKKTLVAGAVGAVGATSVIAYQALEGAAEAPVEAVPRTGTALERQPPAQERASDKREPEAESAAAAPVEAVEERAEPEAERAPTAEEQAAMEEPPRRKVVRSVAPRTEPRAAAQQANPEPEAQPQTPSLEQEVALLDEARAALHAGRTGTALERLSQHAARFPRGSLGLEAEVLRIEALAAAGRHAEASRRAKRILERSPNSIVAARLRRFAQD